MPAADERQHPNETIALVGKCAKPMLVWSRPMPKAGLRPGWQQSGEALWGLPGEAVPCFEMGLQRVEVTDSDRMDVGRGRIRVQRPPLNPLVVKSHQEHPRTLH